jgi:tetratricopeptide (TPR) repeat protein
MRAASASIVGERRAKPVGWALRPDRQGRQQRLEGVAVARLRSDLWLLEALVGDDLSGLEEATTSGMLSAEAQAVSFRHELARLAVEDATPLDRRWTLHRRALHALADPPSGESEPARLAHHADALGDAELVLEYAPRAAQQAPKLGAHREAGRHYQRALQFGEHVPTEVRMNLYAASAYESFLTVDFPGAAAAQEQALRCAEELGDEQQEGGLLTFLAQLRWQAGGLHEALATGEQALATLEDIPSRELAAACCNMACLQLAAEDPAAAMRWAERADSIADTIGDPGAKLGALQLLGWVKYFRGDPDGLPTLDATLEQALAFDVETVVGQTYVIIVRTACRRREWAVAAPYLRDGLEYCATRDVDVWRYYLLSWEAKVQLAHGRWTEAAETATIYLEEPCPFSRIHALVALGLVRARRGDPGVWEPLDEGLALATPRRELQWIAPVDIARAEAAWLEGRSEDAIAETEAVLEDARGTFYQAGLR